MGRRALKDMPIGKRMLVTFGVILALFLVTVVLAALSLLSTGSNFTSFYNGAYEVTNKSSDLRGDIQTFAKYVGYSMMRAMKSRQRNMCRRHRIRFRICVTALLI